MAGAILNGRVVTPTVEDMSMMKGKDLVKCDGLMGLCTEVHGTRVCNME
jgi:hypothetical protein